MHYGKKFLCEITADRKVSFISEAEGSHMDAVSTGYKPKFRVVYNKLLKATKNLPDTIIDFDAFIDVKGMKSQGNQVTKLKVKEIILNHPIEGAPDEMWPEEEQVEPQNELIAEHEIAPEQIEGTEDQIAKTVEWDLGKKDEDDPDQAKLF